jgi:hypothetical protein
MMSVIINFFSSLNINIKWRYAIAKCHANINLIITKMKNCKDLQTNTSCFQITKSNLFLWKWWISEKKS